MAKKKPSTLKKKHLRLDLRDERLEPAPPPKRGSRRSTRKKKAKFGTGELARLFSETLRTRNADLRSQLPDVNQLKRYKLPIWKTEADVAKALGVSLSELRFFATHRRADRFCHYVSFTMPKKSGGERLIMAPKRRLKAILRTLVSKLVHKLPVSEYSHGFRFGSSVRTAAEPHVGKRIVIHMDLKDFFHTVTFARVRGMLVAYGYGYPVATTLAVLMTEAPRQPVEVDGTIYYVPIANRRCVQGAPTSPGICNTMAVRLDRRLSGLAKKFGFSYSRYVDDLVFSGDDTSCVHGLRCQVTNIVTSEGFEVNRDKTRFCRSGGRQRVTGVTVNEKLGLSRKERRLLRAMIHRYHLDREQGKEDPKRLGYLRGKLAYLNMLEPEQARKLSEQLDG